MEATPLHLTDNIEDAKHDLDVAIQETCDDLGPDVNPDDIHRDMVVSIAWNCDDATALELCRRELGHVPYELRLRLGDRDFIGG